MAIQPDLKSESSCSIEPSLDALSPVLAEYPIPLALEPARTPLRRGDAKRRK